MVIRTNSLITTILTTNSQHNTSKWETNTVNQCLADMASIHNQCLPTMDSTATSKCHHVKADNSMTDTVHHRIMEHRTVMDNLTMDMVHLIMDNMVNSRTA